MGEYAEMMLDGTCCCVCGEFLYGDDSTGYPTMCAGCEKDERADDRLSALYDDAGSPPEPRYACPVCDRKLKSYAGYLEHYKAKHPTEEQP